MKQSRTIERRQWLTPLLGLAFLLTGVALLVYILFHVSLGTALACALVFVVAALTWRLYNIHPNQRPVLIRQIGKGLLIGLVATAAYDLSRLAIVEIFALKVWPFEAFRFFGYAIAGEGISRHLAIAVGALYHLGNGIFFSISYCLLLGRQKWFWGVVWALGLEVLMFSVYPTFLNLDAVMKEFTIVSVSGHLAYGTVLGVMAKR